MRGERQGCHLPVDASDVKRCVHRNERSLHRCLQVVIETRIALHRITTQFTLTAQHIHHRVEHDGRRHRPHLCCDTPLQLWHIRQSTIRVTAERWAPTEDRPILHVRMVVQEIPRAHTGIQQTHHDTIYNAPVGHNSAILSSIFFLLCSGITTCMPKPRPLNVKPSSEL